MQWQQWLQQEQYFDGLKEAAEALGRVIDRAREVQRPYARRHKDNCWIQLVDPLPGVRLVAAFVPHTGTGWATLNLNVWIYEGEQFEQTLQRFVTAPKFSSGEHTFSITRGYHNASYERSLGLKGIEVQGINHILRLDDKFAPDASGIQAIAEFVQEFYIYVRDIALGKPVSPAPVAVAGREVQAERDHELETAPAGLPVRRYVDSGGNDLPQRMQEFFDELTELGFVVALTPLTRNQSASRTFRISWSGIYVGQWESRMWLKRDPRVLLYRFQKEGMKTIAEAPPSLTEEMFAEQHAVDAHQVELRPDDGKHYLHVRNEGTALALLQQWAEVIDGNVAPPLRGTPRQVAEDIAQTLADPTLAPTQRKALVDARVGQGRFRADLMREFARGCAVCGVDVPEALRASHIVPWCSSTNTERLDPKNGLLMSANLDALFDRYLITFDNQGRLVASPALSEQQRALLGLGSGLAEPPCVERQAFLQRHAAEFARRVAVEST
jgi:hypothetical protein